MYVGLKGYVLGMPHQPQNILQQQQQQSIWSSSAPPQVQNVVNYTAQIDTITAEQMKLREQITQSEKNLQAQHQVPTLCSNIVA